MNNIFGKLIHSLCQHNTRRLVRRLAPAGPKRSALGSGFNLLKTGPGNRYLYRCPACQTDLPVELNTRWEELYRTFRPAPEPRPTRPVQPEPSGSQSFSGGRPSKAAPAAKARPGQGQGRKSGRRTSPASQRGNPARSSSASPRTPIGAKLRYDVLTRDNWRCVKCGATAEHTRLHVDHKTPVSLGGTNDPANLQTLCEACNLGKGARMG